MPGNQNQWAYSRNRAAIGVAFLAQRGLTASLADGVDQLNAIGVSMTVKKDDWLKKCTPILVGTQGALQASAVGQVDKQPFIVSFPPTIEGAEVAHMVRKLILGRNSVKIEFF
jgi:hypothetical protein